MNPTIANLTEQLQEARRLAGFWRDTAAGLFAASAPLPWENPNPPQPQQTNETETSDRPEHH